MIAINQLTNGQKYFEFDNARWTPISCSGHDGFQDMCPGCMETARDTLDHAAVVERDRRHG